MIFIFRLCVFAMLFVAIPLSGRSQSNKPSIQTNRSTAIHDLKSYLQDKVLQADLDLLSRSKLETGNEAQILLSGIMSHPVRMRLLDLAKRSIVIQAYSINSEAHGRQDRDAAMFIEKLMAARERGVKIYILIDGFTAAFTGIQPALLKLRSMGAKVIRYRALEATMDSPFVVTLFHALVKHIKSPITVNRQHEKLLLIDGEYAVIGGMNWGESYSTGDRYTAANYQTAFLNDSKLIQEIGLNFGESWEPTSVFGWQDTDLLLKGPVLNSIKIAFADRWVDNLATGDRSTEDTRIRALALRKELLADLPDLIPTEAKSDKFKKVAIRYISQQPQQEWYLYSNLTENLKKISLPYLERCPQANITNFYLASIRNAKRQIVWGGHAISPIYKMSGELVAAARRGVKIYLITNSKETAQGLPDGGRMFYSRAACWSRYLLGQAEGNIRIFEWQAEQEIKGRKIQVGSYHSKMFAVDGYLSSIGSYNIAPGSYCAYTENTAVVADVDFTHQVENSFHLNLLNTKEVRAEDLKDIDCQRVESLGHWLFAAGYIERFVMRQFHRIFTDEDDLSPE